MSVLSCHRQDSAGAALFCCQSETLTFPLFFFFVLLAISDFILIFAAELK